MPKCPLTWLLLAYMCHVCLAMPYMFQCLPVMFCIDLLQVVTACIHYMGGGGVHSAGSWAQNPEGMHRNYCAEIAMLAESSRACAYHMGHMAG